MEASHPPVTTATERLTSAPPPSGDVARSGLSDWSVCCSRTGSAGAAGGGERHDGGGCRAVQPGSVRRALPAARLPQRGLRRLRRARPRPAAARAASQVPKGGAGAVGRPILGAARPVAGRGVCGGTGTPSASWLLGGLGPAGSSSGLRGRPGCRHGELGVPGAPRGAGFSPGSAGPGGCGVRTGLGVRGAPRLWGLGGAVGTVSMGSPRLYGIRRSLGSPQRSGAVGQ